MAANLDALTVLAELAASGAAATVEQQQRLARWSGWGAVPQVFDPAADRFAGERARLEALLGADAMAAAARSTLNAHYTDLALAQAVWQAVGRLGFTSGRVLEPGCGPGTFVAAAPDGAQVTGVELEPSTAAIAQALYPQARVLGESFAESRLPPDSFDLTIGNVPFGSVVLHDRTHNPARHAIHNHFIVKSLALTRPGGLVAVLTSRYTLDAANPAARREIAESADLLGAVRLPNGAHERAAGTNVVTDLVVLRRREPGAAPAGAAWERSIDVPTADGSGTVRINEYLAQHPDAVLGELAVGQGAYNAETLLVRPRGDTPIAEQLGRHLDRIVEHAHTAGLTLSSPPDPTLDPGPDPGPDPATDPGAAPAADPSTTATITSSASRTTGPQTIGPLPTGPQSTGPQSTGPGRSERREGLIEQASDGTFTTIAAGQPAAFAVPRSQAAELAQLVGLRDVYVRLLELESTTRGDTDAIAAARAELNQRYDTYAARFGPINRFSLRSTGRVDPDTGEAKTARQRPRQGGFRTDPYAPAVAGLEDFDAATQTAVKTDVFRSRVIAPRAPRRGADTPADAVAICLDTHGHIDLGEVAALLGVDDATAREQTAGLVFHDPQADRLVPAAEYLSGNVRAKLAAAETAAATDPAYTGHVSALRAVQPDDLGPEQITARLGAAWIDAAYIRAFMVDALDDPAAYVEHAGGSTWAVRGRTGGVAATETWGTGRRPAPDLVQALLEQRTIKVVDTIKNPDGSTSTVPNLPETVAAQEKAAEIAARFSDWAWEDPTRAAELAAIYNQQFNAVVLRSYDGAELSLPGLAETFTPRPHQRAAVARMIHEPAVGLFHEVGAGKTAEMAMGLMELRRLGLVRKPAVVVPNNMLEQFGREFAQLYPQAKLLVATTDDLTATRRREFVARIASSDWDAVIMTRSAFERLPLSPDNQQAYLQRESDQMRARIARAKAAEGGRELTVKRLEQAVQAFEERMKRALDTGRRDPGITFENTGLDYAVIDEAHAYKNLATPSQIEGAGISGSQRAADLDMKLSWLREQQGGRIVTLATATPIANSITETWVMQRYTRPDLLTDAGIDDFDQWAATFGQRVAGVEMTPDAGGFRIKERFSRFVNVPELLTLWHVSADIKTAADLALPAPAIAARPDGQRQPETVLLDAPAELRDYVADLGARAEAIRAKAVDPRDDNMLKISADGRAAALDLRLLELDQPAGAKVDVAAERIAGIWAAHRADRFTRDDGTPHPTPGALQIVFCDLGTPSAQRWNVYDTLREQLAARGVPRDQVRFMHEAATDSAKAALFAAARAGQVAVLIGSTEKMGVGTNVQRRAVALHHLDCPWRPADLHQRDGRILRQGNQYGEVQILRYVTEGSFDGYSWQTVERKARFIDQVMRGRLDVREIDDIGENTLSFDEVKALASGDPRVLEKAQVDAEVARLERLERSHHRSQQRLGATIDRSREAIAAHTAAVERIDQAVAARTPTRGDAFRATLDDRTYTERAAFAEALATRLRAPTGAPSGHAETLGQLGGLTLTATHDRGRDGERRVDLDWAEAPGHPVGLAVATLDPRPLGVVSSLESRLGGLERRRDQARAAIDDAHHEIDRAHTQLGQPFTRTDDLATARARADQLRTEMTDLATTPPPAATATPPTTPEPATPDPATPDPAAGAASARTAAPVASLTAAPDQTAGTEHATRSAAPDQSEPDRPAEPSAPAIDTDPTSTEPALGPTPERVVQRGDDQGVSHLPTDGEPRGPRRALFDHVIADHAAEYGRPEAPTGGGPANAARYLIEGHLPHATQAEWDWLEAHLRHHPELLTGPVATAQQRAETARDRETAADRLATHARERFDAGAYDTARDLIDRAELTNPTAADRWDHIRTIIDQADPATRKRDDTTPSEREPVRGGIGPEGVDRARAAITQRNTDRATREQADAARRLAADPHPTEDPARQIDLS